MTFDWFVILAPVLLLPIVALLRFLGCSGPSFGDIIAYFGVAVNCGGPPDGEPEAYYYRDDGNEDGDSNYAEAVFESIGGQSLKVSGSTPITDGHGNPAEAIYATGRTGTDFTYKFSVKPGVYRIILRFAEIGNAQNPGDRVFSFQFENGGTIFGLSDGSNVAYDIVAKAGGRLITRDEEVTFHLTHTQLSIHFVGGSGPVPPALVNAIEVIVVEAIVVTPSSAILLAGETQQYSAVAPGLAVTWEVNSPLGAKGTIDTNGLYTAPFAFTPPAQETIVASTISDNTGGTVTGSATAILYLPIDTTRQGKFHGVYGQDGYVLANTPPDQILPAYVQQFAVSSFDGAGTVNVFADALAGDPRVLDPDGSGTRPAIMWNDVNGLHGITFSFAFTDSQPHLFGVYCFDFDGQGRKQHFEMVQLDSGVTQSVDFTIGNGVYLFWIGSGRIRINITTGTGSTGINNVVNGVFFR